MKNLILAIAVILLNVVLVGCDQAPSSDQVQRQQQETLSQQGNAVAGMPAITSFREKRLLKMIYEMRDQEITTVTYIQDNVGHLMKMCDSIGFGIPAATQYTNPQRIAQESGHYYVTLPQADPNGLYSPSSAEGTWVLCANPKNPKQVGPVYAEPRIITSPFPLFMTEVK